MILTLITALATGLQLIGALAPQVGQSKTVQDIESALALLARVVPSIQNVVDLLQNPGTITQAKVDAAVASMNAHVADWDNRAAATPT